MKNLMKAYNAYVKAYKRVDDNGIFEEVLPFPEFIAYIKSHDKLIRALKNYLDKEQKK